MNAQDEQFPSDQSLQTLWDETQNAMSEIKHDIFREEDLTQAIDACVALSKKLVEQLIEYGLYVPPDPGNAEPNWDKNTGPQIIKTGDVTTDQILADISEFMPRLSRKRGALIRRSNDTGIFFMGTDKDFVSAYEFVDDSIKKYAERLYRDKQLKKLAIQRQAEDAAKTTTVFGSKELKDSSDNALAQAQGATVSETQESNESFDNSETDANDAAVSLSQESNESFDNPLDDAEEDKHTTEVAPPTVSTMPMKAIVAMTVVTTGVIGFAVFKNKTPFALLVSAHMPPALLLGLAVLAFLAVAYGAYRSCANNGFRMYQPRRDDGAAAAGHIGRPIPAAK
ncbi:MAG: hypothetical protein NXI01_04490 [Gammaproteobacteria bacterium]|nr:hypothetical protein [Gammaproteobacteria bacterium]